MITITINQHKRSRVILKSITYDHSKALMIGAIKAVRTLAFSLKLEGLQGLKEANDFVQLFSESVDVAARDWAPVVIESELEQHVLDIVVAAVAYYLGMKYEREIG